MNKSGGEHQSSSIGLQQDMNIRGGPIPHAFWAVL
jgi:hypothetical protein